MSGGGWNELRLHAWLAQRPAPRQLEGSRQHDAAVLGRLGGRPVMCCDQVVLGVHAEHDVDPALFGAKVVLRTLSDLAATAAEPVAVTLAGRFEDERDETWIRAVIEGASDAAERHGAGLVAGDLSGGSGPAGLTATALGRLPGERQPPGRDRGRAGQVLICTGPLGGSRAGRHLRIEPRLRAGRALHELGATALIDVSDGLQLDAERLAQASGLALVLDTLPVHEDALVAAGGDRSVAQRAALSDGEDHELLATLDAAAAARFLERAGEFGVPAATRIGTLQETTDLRAGVWLRLDPDHPACRPPGLGGYVHGSATST